MQRVVKASSDVVSGLVSNARGRRASPTKAPATTSADTTTTTQKAATASTAASSTAASSTTNQGTSSTSVTATNASVRSTPPVTASPTAVATTDRTTTHTSTGTSSSSSQAPTSSSSQSASLSASPSQSASQSASASNSAAPTAASSTASQSASESVSASNSATNSAPSTGSSTSSSVTRPADPITVSSTAPRSTLPITESPSTTKQDSTSSQSQSQSQSSSSSSTTAATTTTTTFRLPTTTTDGLPITISNSDFQEVKDTFDSFNQDYTKIKDNNNVAKFQDLYSKFVNPDAPHTLADVNKLFDLIDNIESDLRSTTSTTTTSTTTSTTTTTTTATIPYNNPIILRSLAKTGDLIERYKGDNSDAYKNLVRDYNIINESFAKNESVSQTLWDQYQQELRGFVTPIVTTTAQPTAGNRSAGLSGAGIAGVAIVCLVAAAAAGVAVYAAVKRSNKVGDVEQGLGAGGLPAPANRPSAVSSHTARVVASNLPTPNALNSHLNLGTNTISSSGNSRS